MSAYDPQETECTHPHTRRRRTHSFAGKLNQACSSGGRPNAGRIENYRGQKEPASGRSCPHMNQVDGRRVFAPRALSTSSTYIARSERLSKFKTISA